MFNKILKKQLHNYLKYVTTNENKTTITGAHHEHIRSSALKTKTTITHTRQTTEQYAKHVVTARRDGYDITFIRSACFPPARSQSRPSATDCTVPRPAPRAVSLETFFTGTIQRTYRRPKRIFLSMVVRED